jgi:hypothetical protein
MEELTTVIGFSLAGGAFHHEMGTGGANGCRGYRSNDERHFHSWFSIGTNYSSSRSARVCDEW